MIAPVALVLGAILGMAGTFVSSASIRSLLWGLDGTFLVLGTAILAVRHFRRGNDLAAAGFLVYVAGQTLVLASAAMDFATAAPLFAGGASLWATSLVLVSTPKVMPTWVRGTGLVAAVLFATVALQIFAGNDLTPLTKPLPFFAYPFLVATLVGWAWVESRDTA